ncbi:hypothetical protein [Rhodothalassium salexigens]|nr:hypothetical protein [Rhodothalassium salexigens]MBB4210648.1 hypothetical protein [Rhodothalassium salexigens DSM 2132]
MIDPLSTGLPAPTLAADAGAAAALDGAGPAGGRPAPVDRVSLDPALGGGEAGLASVAVEGATAAQAGGAPQPTAEAAPEPNPPERRSPEPRMSEPRTPELLSTQLADLSTTALVAGADPAFLGLIQAAETSLTIQPVDILA